MHFHECNFIFQVINAFGGHSEPKKSDFRAIFEDSIFSKFARKYIAEDASKVECLDFLFFLTLFPIYLSVGS